MSAKARCFGATVRGTVVASLILSALISITPALCLAESTPAPKPKAKPVLVIETADGKVEEASAECEALLLPAVPDRWVAEMIEKGKAPSPQSQRLRDVVQRNGFTRTALNQQVIRDHNESYTTITALGPVTNQQSSGRCWIFAGLNSVVSSLVAQDKVPTDFEFSENYLHFFSMLEQANRYLERVVQLSIPGGARTELSRRELRAALAPHLGDGGFYQYFTYLVSKYGLVPKSAMPETISSENTGTLLAELHDYLGSVANQIIAASKTLKKPDPENESEVLNYLVNLRAFKLAGMSGIWRILSTHLGDPPSRFEFRMEKGITQKGLVGKVRTHRKEYTPLEFAQEFVQFDPSQFVVVASFPNRKVGRLYEFNDSSIGYPGLGEEPLNVRYLNLTPERLEDLAAQSIESGTPVWFAADVRKDVDHRTGIMHPKIYEREGVYGMSEFEQTIPMSRKEKSYFGLLAPVHAMALTGVDRAADGSIVKFRNENSWGEHAGSEGIYHMYRDWFRENVFYLVVPRALLSEEELKALKRKPQTRTPDMY